MQTYTSRTLALLHDLGYRTGPVETWVPQPGVPGGGFRRDLFGIADLIAVPPDGGPVLLVQSTGPNGHAAHRRTMLASPHLPFLTRHPGLRVVLISWRKLLVRRGGKARRWNPRWEDLARTLAGE